MSNMLPQWPMMVAHGSIPFAPQGPAMGGRFAQAETPW
jgi:hypothetical protein